MSEPSDRARQALHEWGWDRDWERHVGTLEPGRLVARVVAQHRGEVRLASSLGETVGVAPGRMTHRATGARQLPAVGDWVIVQPEADGPATILEILPRRTEFVRRRAGTEAREQVIAANVDVALLLIAASQPLNAGRLERYLAATRDSGAEPVVLLSKIDLVDDPEPLLRSARAVSGDAPVLGVSAQDGTGLEALGSYLQPGRTVALLGTSGVGKSTLLNVLAGSEMMRTQSVRHADDKGRHTTTHREIFRLPCGALVLDTPGMRELGLWGAEQGVQETFEDIDALIGRCRFRDCTHEQEPGCAVRAALQAGELHPSRWASYRKLQLEAAYQSRSTDQATALGERRRWKQIHKQQRPKPKKRP